MAYDYKELIEKKGKEDPAFRKKIDELKEKRKKEVDVEAGITVTGDVEVGRPTLGGGFFVTQFRILRIVGLRWGLAKIVGKKAGDGITYNIGIGVGKDLIKKGVVKGKTIDEFLTSLATNIEGLKIGIASVTEWSGDFPKRIRVDECITCAGMLNIGKPVCHYEGGVIAGALSEFYKKEVRANEIACWGQGDEYCEFELEGA